MHPHTVDWLRTVEFQSDSTLAQKFWNLAVTYEAQISRLSVAQILRLFLFVETPEAMGREVTEAFLKLDPDFPVTGNAQYLRVMAGIVIAASFERRSHAADAFALGLRAAHFAGARGQPAIGEVMHAAEVYILAEAARQRPNDFSAASTSEATLDDDVERIDNQVGRLAEEIQLLWWVVGMYSPTLNAPTDDLSAVHYALIAAAEANERIQILPPPPAARAVLARALAPCKAPNVKAKFERLLNAADSVWLDTQVLKTQSSDCRALVPITTGLEKMHEMKNAKQAAQSMASLCPDMKADWTLTPIEGAMQYFAELGFLAALRQMSSN